jgi:hypothetical protein
MAPIRRRNTPPLDTAGEKDLEYEPFRRGCLGPENRDLTGPVAARSESESTWRRPAPPPAVGEITKSALAITPTTAPGRTRI